MASSALMEKLANDVRSATRALRRTPASTSIAALTLAFGIAGTTLLFGVVYGVLLRPLPYPDADRLVQLWQFDPARPNVNIRVSPPNIADWRAQSRTLEGIAYSTAWAGANSWSLIGRDGHERIAATFVSANFFRVYGVPPLLGRTFSDDEDEPNHAATVVISHGFWQSHFDSDPQVLGRTVTLDSYWRRTYTIVGVMPAGFNAPARDDVWMPMGYSEIRVPGSGDASGGAASRCCPWFHVIARMKPGVSLAQARAEMDTIAARIAQTYPEADSGRAVKLVPLHEQRVGDVRLALLLLFAAVGCVLLIACVNVANLQLARAASREREIAVRVALGARAADIVRQLLVESVMLSATGGALGLLLAMWGMRVARVLLAERLPDANDMTVISIDPFVLSFSITIALLTGVLFGLAPAWQATRVRPQEALKHASGTSSPGRAHRRVRAALVIGEIAMALVLLSGASVLIRSLVRLQHVDPGFRPERLLIVSLDMTSTAFDGPGRTTQFFDALKAHVAGYAGVQAVSGVIAAPMTNAAAGSDSTGGSSYSTGITVEGRPFLSMAQSPRADRTAIAPDYFRTLGIPLLKGREFTSDDRADRPNVAIITETMARQLWPNEDALGKRFTTLTRDDLARFHDRNGRDWRVTLTEVVGIVGDVRQQALASAPRPLMFVPYLQFPWHSAQLLVRTSGDPLAIASHVRADARALNPAAIITRVQTMDDAVAASTSGSRLGTWMATLFAGAGMLLAALGLYGVMAHGVVSRTREIGVRIALGATRGEVLALILRQGLLMTLAGIAIGSIGLIAASRIVGSMLYETSPADPVALMGTIVLLIVVALAAAYGPARRATQVDPLIALRDE